MSRYHVTWTSHRWNEGCFLGKEHRGVCRWPKADGFIYVTYDEEGRPDYHIGPPRPDLKEPSGTTRVPPFQP